MKLRVQSKSCKQPQHNAGFQTRSQNYEKDC